MSGYERYVDESGVCHWMPRPESPFEVYDKALKRERAALMKAYADLAAANRRAWRHLGRHYQSEANYYRLRRRYSETITAIRTFDEVVAAKGRAARLCNYWGREPEE